MVAFMWVGGQGLGSVRPFPFLSSLVPATFDNQQ